MLGDDLGPRLYVEPVGQGDSDKPRNYRYSTMERADLVEALWRHHGVRRTVVVTFDYTSLALLELLRRTAERADARPGDRGRVHDERRPVRRLAHPPVAGHADAAHARWARWPCARRSARQSGSTRRCSGRGCTPAATAPARRSSPNCGRRSPAGTVRQFLHRAAGFVQEHRRHAQRWDLAAVARDLPDRRRVRRRQRGRPLRAPPGRRRPDPRAQCRRTDLSWRSPDHQRAPGPARRRHPRDRRRHGVGVRPDLRRSTDDQAVSLARAQRGVRP